MPRVGILALSSQSRSDFPFTCSQPQSSATLVSLSAFQNGRLTSALPRSSRLRKCALCAAVLFVVGVAQAQIDDQTKQLAHDIFKQLIEINTTDSVGSVTAASEAMAQRFRDAGFPESDLRILGPNDRKKTWSSACMAAKSIDRFFSSATSMSSRPAAKTGPPTRFNSSKKTATSMAAARRT